MSAATRRKVVIFGTQDLAQLAKFYLETDAGHEVSAFAVDAAYLKGDRFEGLPVVPFEDLESRYSPSEFELFIPMTQKKMGKIRELKYLEGKRKGYRFISYVSSKATWWKDASPIGENCFIFEDNTIQPFATIGNNVVLWSGNHIGHHSRIGDHTFLTSHVVISGHVDIQPHSFFGVNATVRDGITIGEGTLVGMAASITKNTDPWGIYLGSPAKKLEKSSLEADI